MIADRGPRVDVDAGPPVGPFRHHPRDERHLEPVEEMGEPMDRHRLEAGIAEDDLVERPHGGIAVERRLNVGRQNAPNVGDPFEKLDRLRLAERLEVALLGAVLRRLRRHRQLDALLSGSPLGGDAVPQCPADLRGELVMQAVDQVADVVGDVPEVEVLAASIARVENLLEILAGGDDRLVVRQRAVAEVVDRRYFLVRLDDPPRQLGQLLLDPHVSGHGFDGRGGKPGPANESLVRSARPGPDVEASR